MNTENILKVADAIERCSIPGLEFDMGDFFYESGCGTAACIAGWAWHVEGQKTHPMSQWQADSLSSEDAERFLGIDDWTAKTLFFGGPLMMSEISREMAVHCLRNLAATGKVDWLLAQEALTP